MFFHKILSPPFKADPVNPLNPIPVFIAGDKEFSFQVQQSRKMSFSVLMMTDDFYLIRQYNRHPGAQGLGGSNDTKPREVLNMSDLHNQGSTNTRNLRRILH
jgi:hypothetical protein